MIGAAGWKDFADVSGPAQGGALREAAARFEGLLIAEMLKAAREEGGAGQEGDTTMREVAEECLAQTLSAQGGLGLGRLIERQLRSAVQRRADS